MGGLYAWPSSAAARTQPCRRNWLLSFVICLWKYKLLSVFLASSESTSFGGGDALFINLKSVRILSAFVDFSTSAGLNLNAYFVS